MNREKITQLRQLIIKQLCPLINNDYVLLDIPNHSNIGDNLIWEGELLFLKQNLSQYNMRYSANFINCDLSNVSSNDIILMHGGGNWGDLYPACQNLRVKVVKKFPHNRIIIFPQTVFYNDKSKLKLECSVFNSHSDIHICLRDEVSYNILKEYISEDKLLLLPDMAFFIDIQSEKNLIIENYFLKEQIKKLLICLFIILIILLLIYWIGILISIV